MKMKNLLFKLCTALLILSFFSSITAFGQATLMHSYDFEDGTADDGTGTLDGTVNGSVTIADGWCTVGPAANGQGQNYGYVSFNGSDLALNGYSAITLEAMIVAGNGDNDWYTMLYYFGDNAANYVFSQMTEGNWNANVKTTTTEGEEGAWYGSIIDDGGPHHIVAVLTSTSLSFWVDGVRVDSTNGTGFITPIGTTFAHLFRGPDAWNDDNWIGSFEEFNIYEGVVDSATIVSNAQNYIDNANAFLSDLTVDVGTLTPVFDSTITHYAIEVPAATSTVNLTATPSMSGAGVTGDGAIDISGGETTATIEVTALDGKTIKTYSVDIMFEDATCFVPLYDYKTNIVPDPEMTDLANYAGWGTKNIVYGFEAYCGLTAAKLAGYCGGSLDLDLDATGMMKANTKYRLKAMVYVVGSGKFKLGLFGTNVPGFIVGTEQVDTWETIDTTFTSGADVSDFNIYFNSCEGFDGETGYLDNWEIYEISTDATLSDLTVDGSTISGFDPATHTYNVVLPPGTTEVPVVAATVNEAHADAVVTQASALPGSTTVVVTAEDGTTQLTYTINFDVGLSTDATLSDLQVDGVTVEGFSSGTYTYDIALDEGTTDVPVVTAITTYVNATAVITPAAGLPGSTTVEVTAEDGTTQLTYTINFTVKVLTLMHAYTFEDSTANDTVGTAHGTFHGTTYDSTGGAFTSTSDGDYISFVGTELALNTYSTITTEIYVRAGDASNPAWSMLNYFGGANGDNAYFTSIARNDDVSRTEYVGGAAVNGPELEDGKLHHIVSVLTNTSITFYIDGELIGTAGHSKLISDMKMDNALLGESGWDDPSWLGSIYEYNIYEGEMSANTVSAHSSAFLDPSDARLAVLTVDVGTLTPDFDARTTHYAIAVPSGTSTVNVTATAKVAGATVTGDGSVAVVPGETTDTIKVTSQDGTEVMTYTIDVVEEMGVCYTPLYDDRPNLIPDPEMTDVTKYQGWGHKGIAYGFEAYCGLSVMKFDAVTNTWPEGAAMDVNDMLWVANSTYRVHFMYKTMDGSLGLLARDADPDFLISLPHTEGKWKEFDTIFPTGDSPGTGNDFITINNVDASSTAKIAYIDNYELYKVSTDATLSDLMVDGTTIDGFHADSLDYDVVLELGTTVVPTVTATTSDTDAVAVITPAAALPGATTVDVAADDGWTTLTYTVNFSVEPDTVATLSDLKVNGVTVPGFASDDYDYNVELPSGTSSATVTATATSSAAAITGAGTIIFITGSEEANVVVTAEDGTTQKTYTVSFTFVSSDATLSDLKYDGTAITLTDGVYHYNVELDAGTTTPPTVTATATHANASVDITQATTLPDTALVDVTAEDGTTKLQYSIGFTVKPDFVESNTISNISIFPNPTNGMLTVTNVENSIISVYELNGTLLRTIRNADRVVQIDVSNLAAGVYILNVQMEEGVLITRFHKE